MSNKTIKEEPVNTGDNSKKIDWKKEILSYVIIIAIAYIASVLLTKFVIIKTEIISGSMIPTMLVDDKVVGNRLAYLFDEPERGDIVFFAFPDDESKTYVKRVIGLPGETVTIKNNKVYINDSEKPLTEKYLKEKMYSEDGVYVVPEGKYFMLGDNRNISADSREWDDKYVEKSKIYGKAWFRYSPSFGSIKSAVYE